MTQVCATGGTLRPLRRPHQEAAEHRVDGRMVPVLGIAAGFPVTGPRPFGVEAIASFTFRF